MRLVILTAVLVFICGCDTQSPRGRGSPDAPVTSFGQAVKQGRDISSELSDRDSDIADQVDAMDE